MVSLFGKITDWIKYIIGLKIEPPPFKEPEAPKIPEPFPVPTREPDIPEEFEEEDEDEVDTLYTRKYLGTIAYCSGKTRHVFAVTYENNDVNREEELIDAIVREFSNTCKVTDDYGYDDNDQSAVAPFIYPEIQVGEI